MGQYRVLLGAWALMQAITVPGVWATVSDGGAAAVIGGLIAGLIAMAVFARCMLDWAGRWVFRRREAWTTVLVAFNPVWVAVPAAVGAKNSEDVGIAVMTAIGLGLLHILPGQVLATGAFARVGRRPDDWGPHDANRDGRSAVLLGLSVLLGGWTAAIGMGAYGLVWGGLIGTEELIQAGAWLTFAMPFGMVLGFFCGIFSSTIPVPTRFDRSVPRLFLPAMGAGVIGSAVNPLIGVVAAGGMLLLMGIVVRRTCRLHPPGCCAACGYSLEGIDAVVCPECGHAVGSTRA